MVKKTDRRWIDELDDEDLAFLKRFLLSSGSLKKLAAQYGVSYPTVRRRLDRLMAKVEALDSRESFTEFERLVRVLFADRRLDAGAAESLLGAHQKEIGDRE